ncbi:(2Fe-2S)-binding protein [Streptomyces sp. NPDC001315]|uniref:(2Fe-2S)-binding protein n=1 Tax=Streptomyces sp. NPDC001315 TaxID=3364562 RepID=UPI0036A1296F
MQESTGQHRQTGSRFSRRGFLGGTAAVGAVGVGAVGVAQGSTLADSAPDGTLTVRLKVNGSAQTLHLDPRATLLDTLRERLELTGTKKGCDRGQCGACTVHVDGRRVLSCLTLAAAADGSEVTTIEGLEPAADRLHPMQQAFVDCDGFQCGFCTSGQIMSAVALVEEGRAHTDDEIREHMSGNICRCSAYPNIVRAVQDGKKAMS